MPVQVKFDPHVTMPQVAVIQDATPENDGVMTKEQAAKLAGLTPGGGAFAFNVVPTTSNIGASFGDFVVADSTAGNISVNLPAASSVDPTGTNIVAIKNDGTGGHTVGVNLHAGDGADFVRTLTDGESIMVVSDGVTTWYAVAGYGQASGAGLNLTPVKTADYNAVVDDYVQCDPTAAPFNVTLPSAAASGGAAVINVKNKTGSVNSVTVLPSGGDTIDLGPSVDIPAFGSQTFVSDGVSDWMISA